MRGLTCSLLKSATSYSKWKHMKTLRRQCLSTSSPVFGVFEPDGLNPPPEIPEYKEIFVRIRGYDYPPLESFSRFVFHLARRMEMEPESIAAPASVYSITTLKPRSTKVEHSYKLKKYERRIMLENVPSTTMPIFIDIMKLNTPQGIEVRFKELEEEEEDYLYIPDVEMENLQARIEEATIKK